MSLSEAQVLDALGDVEEPLLRRTLGDLGLVRGARVERRGKVTVDVGLVAPDSPEREELAHRVGAAVQVLPGVGSVHVELSALSEHDEGELRRRLEGDRPDVGRDGTRVPTFATPGSNTRVLAISSGKGGVGKSSVTVNLAIALSRLGQRVGVLDADVYGFSVPKMLGIDRDPTVVAGLLIPPVAYDVACISMGFFVEDDQPVIWRGPMLHKALEQFLNDVWWGDIDYLLIDMPPGTGDVAITMAQYLPRSEVYVVTTPQPAAQRVAQRTAFMAEKVNLEVYGVIENMSWFTGDDGTRYELFGAGGGQELAEKLNVPLIGQVPLVPALREGGDVGRPVTVADPDGEAAQAVLRIAEHVTTHGPRRRYRPELTIR